MPDLGPLEILILLVVIAVPVAVVIGIVLLVTHLTKPKA
jgi:formate-dependent nitrite reductase membrane component NrfD